MDCIARILPTQNHADYDDDDDDDKDDGDDDVGSLLSIAETAGGTRLFLLGMRLETREKRSGREKETVARGSLTRRWKLASDKIKLLRKARKRRISSLTFSLLSRARSGLVK